MSTEATTLREFVIERTGQTLKAVAERLEINPVTLSRYLNGKLPVPGKIRLALAYLCECKETDIANLLAQSS